ncbi:MAG: acyltransferase [Planctomycetota bacterium]
MRPLLRQIFRAHRSLRKQYWKWMAHYWLSDVRELGRHPRCYGRPQIDGGRNITIGDDVRLVSNITPCWLDARKGRIDLGNHVTLAHGVQICSWVHVSIGDDCVIGSYTRILDSDFHQIDPGEPLRTEPVTIGRNVWIPGGAQILRGVTIGDGSVVALGALVTEDVPPRSIVAGTPAKVVRTFEADAWR